MGITLMEQNEINEMILDLLELTEIAALNEHHSCFLNSTTGLWQYCQNGWYYDGTAEIWRDCQGIWTGECNYQTTCYQWSSGSVYDTDLLKWVNTWVSPKVLHHDTQYTINPIWRSPNIYINSQSTSIIELGTIKYPFKNSQSAFSEVLNQYSHSNNNISIYIKENTELKITKEMAYFINITSVSISSYSNSSSSPKYAQISIVDGIQNQTIKTLFSILSDNTYELGNVISEGSFAIHEKELIEQSNVVFAIIRSSFSISNITAFTDLITDDVFINFVSTEIKQLDITNIYFDLSGHLQSILIFFIAFLK